MTSQDRRYRVLAVDRTARGRKAFGLFLRRNRGIFIGRTAGSLAEAGKLLAPGRFDVVVTDCRLADGTGFDVLRMAGDAHVIFTACPGNEDVAVRALKAGACDCLVKDAEGGYLKLLSLAIVRAMSRRRAEREARMLSAAVRSIADVVFVTDMNGNIVFVNAAFCGVYGYGEREALWEREGSLWEGGEAPAGKGLWKGEAVHRRKDGERFPVDYSRSVLREEGGRAALLVHVVRDIGGKKKLEAERERLIAELRDALGQVKRLSGLLPICASCKQIRDEKGGWSQIETYIESNSEANFTHGVCPDCAVKLYPEYVDDLAGMEAAGKPK